MLSPNPRGINVALVGVGNCASSLVQGLAHYRSGANDTTGLMHHDLGGYEPGDIRVVAAWDIDRRKVGELPAGTSEDTVCEMIGAEHG